MFGVSVFVLGAVVYYAATSSYDAQLRATVTSEVADLRELYIASGGTALKAAISERLQRREELPLEYAFYQHDGRLIVGSLPDKRLDVGWATFIGPPGRDQQTSKSENIAVFTVPLPGGQWLAVGKDLNPVEKLGRAILRAFGWALGVSVSLAAVGGALLSALFLRRIDSMARTAQAISEGEIHSRIPTRGTKDDLDRLAITFNRMLDRISSLMETTRQITNDIAHDMRTPIGHLRQSLDNARRCDAGETEMKAAIERAIGETDSILETFAALLRIAQIESGSRKAGFRTLDLSELIENILQTFRPSFEDAGKVLLSSVAPDVLVLGDRELLSQMIINLLENALIHTPAFSRIEVSLRADRVPILEISDNGPGVSLEEREKIFRRFYRLDRSRTSPGNGLGLALVSAIATLHAISIEIRDNHPGLRMVLQLPKRTY